MSRIHRGSESLRKNSIIFLQVVFKQKVNFEGECFNRIELRFRLLNQKNRTFIIALPYFAM